MKKLILSLALVLAALSLKADTSYSTNVPSGTHPLITNRLTVTSVQILATNNTTVYFYDQNAMGLPYYGTNVVIPEYVSAASYSTNMWRTYVDYTGFTNTVTNRGIFTYYITNAASTNVLAPMAILSATAYQAELIPVDWLFSRGIIMRSPTYGVGVNITYHP